MAMAWFKCRTSWCLKKYVLQHCHNVPWFRQAICSVSSSSGQWTSTEVRQMFLQYFKDREHQYVHSSSVLPHKDDGTYFVNAGMNQFKPIFLGTVDPDGDMAKYRRVVNSQKCIRISGKHNDLDDVGQDSYHHTFFEMLGSWSFNNYFKREACEMALDLLTNVYKLPKDHLYVTYFSGMKLGEMYMEPDIECKEIWQSLGIAPDHLLPFETDNFWSMGDTGPCGHCTEIHYDQSPGGNARHLVNQDSPHVVELCNLVFMVYDRQANDKLVPLPARHVDTGMGLERLTAVLQGKHSNYDTDLFQPLIETIQQNTSCRPYEGRFGEDDVGGIDTAYRIIADHSRMFTVAMADGVMPGNLKSPSRVRQIIDNCLYQSTQVLKQPAGSIGKLVPVVVDILGGAFPEVSRNLSKVKDMVDASEHRYLELLHKGSNFISRLRESGTNELSGPVLRDLQGGVTFKTRIPLHISRTVAANMNMRADVEAYNEIMEAERTKGKRKNQDTNDELMALLTDVTHLESSGVPQTEDKHKYKQAWDDHTGQVSLQHMVPAIVLEIKFSDTFVDDSFVVMEGDLCTIIVDTTPFYAESGGQVSDSGYWENEDCTFNVLEVKERGGYIFHFGHMERGSLKRGHIIHPSVDMIKRQTCAINHTATHLLNNALQHVASDVMQQGSWVGPDELVFDFSCSNSELPYKCLDTITSLVTDLINKELIVDVDTMPLKQAMTVPALCFMANENYPSMPRVVSIGVHVKDLSTKTDRTGSQSVELCAGCHVDNLKRIERFVITHFDGMSALRIKRVKAVTEKAAQIALENAAKVKLMLDHLTEDIQKGYKPEMWYSQVKDIEKFLFGEEDHDLPKIDRDSFIKKTDQIKTEHVNKMKNKMKKRELEKEVELLTQSSNFDEYVVAELTNHSAVKKIAAALSRCAPVKPVMLFSRMPKDNAKVLKGHLSEHRKKGARVGIAMAYVPSQFTKKYPPERKATAEGWLQYLDSMSHDRCIMIKDIQRQRHSNNQEKENNSEMHFMTMYIDTEHSIEYFINLAQNYMDYLPFDYANEQNSL